MSENEILYHYTDFVALNGILDIKDSINNTPNGIRLYNIKYMNDPREVMYYVDSVKNELLNRVSSDNDKIVKINELFSIYKNTLNDNPRYVFSMSKACDVYHQWKEYANGGKGVVIGFDREKFHFILNNIKEVNGIRTSDLSMLNDVFYQESVVQSVYIDCILNYLETGVVEIKINGKPKVLSDIKTVISNLYLAAICYKNPIFKAEEEVRYIVDINKTSSLKTYYDVRNDVIKDYKLFEWKSLCDILNIKYNEFIRKIIIGPNSPTDINVFKRYLIDNNLECLVDCVEKSENRFW